MLVNPTLIYYFIYYVKYINDIFYIIIINLYWVIIILFCFSLTQWKRDL